MVRMTRICRVCGRVAVPPTGRSDVQPGREGRKHTTRSQPTSPDPCSDHIMANAPHFVLFSESTAAPGAQDPLPTACDGSARHWHFVLRTHEGTVALDVADEEADASEERLALLAVVRGLEAIPVPSRVTLVTTSGWIRRGLRFGLDNWRDQQWQWERFGKMTPIKNADLWQRVDHALRYHEVDCRTVRVDRPSDDLTRPIPRMLDTRQDTLGSLRVPAPQPASRPSRGPSRSALGHLVLAMLRHLFGWCGLCRTETGLVMAAQ